MIERYHTLDEEGRRVHVEVDLDFDPISDDTVWMLWAFAPLAHPNETTGCTETEWETLREIRATLADVLELRNGALYAGTRLQDGWAEFYFYAAWNKGAEKQFRDVFKQHGYERIEFGANRDTHHRFYHETLFPDAYELQQIKSRDIIEALAREGDDLAAVRDVEHYLFFQTETAMQRCAMALAETGGRVETGLAEEGRYPHGLVLTLGHDCRLETLQERTRPLIEAALREHGTYRGWSTTLAADA